MARAAHLPGRSGQNRLLGDVDLAEEALQEAFAAARERWPAEGIPPNPRAPAART
jgi:predicted RNA polymerase sigma factor